MMNLVPEEEHHIFEERAEYLSEEELSSWTTPFPDDSLVLGKLTGPGAKLLTGPRGSGKSTYLRRAYFSLLKEGPSLPVYVNYSKSLALEPLFHSHASAALVFRQWVLLKIIQGLSRTAKELGLGSELPKDFVLWETRSSSVLDQLQTGQVPDFQDVLLSPTQLIDLAVSVASSFGRGRIVLLLDDAAHAFSPEQQREFFEIFRELRTREVAPKAAVYPGITSYSSNFHVGHEAELVEAWYKPEDPDYVVNMKAILERRLPENLKKALFEKEDVLTLITHASFGMPRALLNMVSLLIGDDVSSPKTPSRASALVSIRTHAQSVLDIFLSLKKKMPRFKQYVDIGASLHGAILESLKSYNTNKLFEAKTTVFGIEHESSNNKLERIINFFEYAGMLRRIGTLSKGKQVYTRFRVHHAWVVEANALALGKSFSLADLNVCLGDPGVSDFVRRKPSTLLGDDFDDKCTLALPECSKCGEPRILEEQRFCMKCGGELASVSLYKELLMAPVDALPLPAQKIEKMKSVCGFTTVQDVLTDDTGKLRDAPYIGEVWQRRIRTCAEEFVGV